MQGRRTIAEMKKIKAALLDYVKRCKPACSMEDLAREFKVSAPTISKWFDEEGINRWRT